MGLSNDLCEARSFSCRLLNTHMFSIRGLRLYFPELKPWVRGLFHSPAVPSSLSVLECGVAGSAISRTACPVCPTIRHLSGSGCIATSPILPGLPDSSPPTGLDECFFFISLVVGPPCSSIFCQFWFFVFKLLLSFFWLCEEAQCVYLCLHLGRNSVHPFFLYPPAIEIFF